MTTVSAFERAIVRDRHRRRPRTSSFYQDIATAASQPLRLGMSAPEPSFSFHASLPQEVAFPDPASTVEWIFWSIDGQAGRVQTVDPEHFWITATGETTMTAAAWYGPSAGAGTQPPGPTDIMVDAFSAVTGLPLDDDFVTVVSDPALTAQANDDGWVPTAASVTVEARASIGELSFDQWIVVRAGSPALDDADQLLVPERADGMALAVYVASDAINDVPAGPAIWNRWVRDLAAVGGLLLTRTDHAATQSPLEDLELRLSANRAIRALASDLDVTSEVAKLLDDDSWAAIGAVARSRSVQK